MRSAAARRDRRQGGVEGKRRDDLDIGPGLWEVGLVWACWNGTAWTIQPTPNPAGGQYGGLGAVACPSASACVAVGYYRNEAGRTVTLAERWNGTRWAIQPAPRPADAEDTYLYGVACPSIAECIAVGDYTSTAGLRVTLVERYRE